MEGVASQARFAVARIYESQGKLEQARVQYEELARSEANSSIGNEAGIKAEELRLIVPQVVAAPLNTNTIVSPPILSTPTDVAPNKP